MSDTSRSTSAREMSLPLKLAGRAMADGTVWQDSGIALIKLQSDYHVNNNIQTPNAHDALEDVSQKPCYHVARSRQMGERLLLCSSGHRLARLSASSAMELARWPPPSQLKNRGSL